MLEIVKNNQKELFTNDEYTQQVLLETITYEQFTIKVIAKFASFDKESDNFCLDFDVWVNEHGKQVLVGTYYTSTYCCNLTTVEGIDKYNNCPFKYNKIMVSYWGKNVKDIEIVNGIVFDTIRFSTQLKAMFAKLNIDNTNLIISLWQL